MGDSDAVAQFCAVTGAEVDTAQQYLSATDNNIEQAVELFFASGGVSIAGQTSAIAGDAGSAAPGGDDAFGAGDDTVRERIERRTERLVDTDAGIYSDFMRPRVPAVSRTPRGIFNQGRDSDLDDRMPPHERRLAELFRPPFDIIDDLDFETAKEEAQAQKLWIMVNIQDPSEFACQQLNRDLWRNENIKDVVRENFIFLQFDADSEEGQMYRVLYPFDSYPHISIIDPWTGEQQRVWHKVPPTEQFLEQVVDFLGQTKDPHQGSAAAAGPSAGASAAGSAVASGTASVAASGAATPAESAPVSQAPSGAGSFVGFGSSAASTEASKQPTPAAATAATDNSLKNDVGDNDDDEEEDATAAIAARDIPEPPAGPGVTRIQLRLGNGQRFVRRFNLSDTVETIFAYIKHAVPEFQGKALTLTSERRNLASELGKTVDEANLKNSVVLVELH